MSTYGSQNFTSFSGVNIKGSIALRVGGNDTYAGTLAISGGSLDGARAWAFPNKNGSFPIAGTFAVQLPAGGGSVPWFSTTVTVAGITPEDGLTVNLHERGLYTFGSQGTQYILLRGQPGAGVITLFFNNLGNGTGYIDLVGSYTAVR